MDDMACIDLSDQEGDGGGGFFGPKLPIQICLTSCVSCNPHILSYFSCVGICVFMLNVLFC
jgi:hypothetical protein